MTSTRPPIETSRSAGYMDQPIPVSAVILTYNEEKNIETCLKSIARWCQEIFVVDSGSRDKTLDIVAQYTSQVYVHSYIDHASQCDAQKLAQALQQMIHNHERRKELGTNGMRLVKSKFTWDKVAAEMIRVYQDILDKHRNRNEN